MRIRSVGENFFSRSGFLAELKRYSSKAVIITALCVATLLLVGGGVWLVHRQLAKRAAQKKKDDLTKTEEKVQKAAGDAIPPNKTNENSSVSGEGTKSKSNGTDPANTPPKNQVLDITKIIDDALKSEEPNALSQYIEKALKGGNSEEQYQLAKRLKNDEKHADNASIIPLYQKAAELGHSHAQYDLGCSLVKSFLVARVARLRFDHTEKTHVGFSWIEEAHKGLEWIEKSAEQNHIDALRYLGKEYLAEEDNDKAITYFQKAADLGDEEAKSWLGFMCQLQIITESPVYKDQSPELAIKAIKQQFDLDPNGCRCPPPFLYYLACAYERNLICEDSPEASKKMISSLYHQIVYQVENWKKGELNRGFSIEYMSKFYKEALDRILKSGDSDLQYSIGIDLSTLIRGPELAKKALDLFQKASESGHGLAKIYYLNQSIKVGRLYFNNKENENAVKCFRQAADFGDNELAKNRESQIPLQGPTINRKNGRIPNGKPRIQRTLSRKPQGKPLGNNVSANILEPYAKLAKSYLGLMSQLFKLDACSKYQKCDLKPAIEDLETHSEGNKNSFYYLAAIYDKGLEGFEADGSKANSYYWKAAVEGCETSLNHLRYQEDWMSLADSKEEIFKLAQSLEKKFAQESVDSLEKKEEQRKLIHLLYWKVAASVDPTDADDIDLVEPIINRIINDKDLLNSKVASPKDHKNFAKVIDHYYPENGTKDEGRNLRRAAEEARMNAQYEYGLQKTIKNLEKLKALSQTGGN